MLRLRPLGQDKGKGFAVASDSEAGIKSASASKDIAVMLSRSDVKVEQGAKLAAESGKTLNTIIASVYSGIAGTNHC